MFGHFVRHYFDIDYSIVKVMVPNPTKEKTPIKSPHAYLSHTYSYNKIYVGLSVDISS